MRMQAEIVEVASGKTCLPTILGKFCVFILRFGKQTCLPFCL